MSSHLLTWRPPIRAVYPDREPFRCERKFLVSGACFRRSCLPSFLLCSLDLHEESFEFRRISIRVNGGGRQQIRRVERGLAFVLLDAAIAPVDWNADLVRLFA